MTDYLRAVRWWVAAVERVANTSPAVGPPADPYDRDAWYAAHVAEEATIDVFTIGQEVWA